MYYSLLSPKVDFVFKRIFGNEQHPEILISFLNAVIKSKDPIKSIEIRNTDIECDARLDVRATTDRDEEIDIEIQVRNEYNMVKRTLYYWSRMYGSQLTEKGKYSSLKRTICINVLDFSLLPCDKFHSVYRLKDTESNEELTDVMEIHFIELPKAKHQSNDTDILKSWVNFINNPSKSIINTQVMQDALNELVRLSSDEKERFLYEKRVESLIELNSSIDSGFEKGRAEGIEKGRAEGSLQTSLQIAKNLLDSGINIETICLTTKLTREEVERLNDSVNKMSLV